MSSPVTLESQAVCEVMIESATDGRVRVHAPGTDYHLDLACDDAETILAPREGDRVPGVIRAKALRIHSASGGGQFIEPVSGEPRIIAGRLLAVDTAAHTLLVRAAVPMVVEAEENRDLSGFEPGRLVTFYVESGTSFTPVSE